MTVETASRIATACGMSETLVGLTIVSIGTSLPELVTSIVAARKNEVGMALGNAIGSNVFITESVAPGTSVRNKKQELQFKTVQ